MDPSGTSSHSPSAPIARAADRDGGDDAPEPDERRSDPLPANAVKTAIDIEATDETGRLDERGLQWLCDHLTRIAALAGIRTGALGITIVDDARMAQLHEQYAGESGTTDVLTFDLGEPDATSAESVDGDVVVCIDEAARQAAERGHETRHEVLLYGVHGLLHLLGHDDHDERGYQRMHELEDALLARAGLAPVFDRPARTDD